MKKHIFLLSALAVLGCLPMARAQQLLQTGGRKMPAVWIDKDTHHRVQRLTLREGNSRSFYFHNNPFIPAQSNKPALMIFYGNDAFKADGDGTNLFSYDMNTGKTVQLTFGKESKHGEIVARQARKVYYQQRDSVFSVDVDSRNIALVYVFSPDFKGSITTLNADETLLAGAWSTDAEKQIARQYPEKRDFFTRIYESHLPRTLFTIDVNTGALNKLFTDTAWLNHVQFSPTDPHLLMFCHEGPWHKVDRIWTIDIASRQVKLVHARTMPDEIAGHEWFSADGKTIWYDLQLPRGKRFLVGGTDLASGKQTTYELDRNQWSVHYCSSPDGTLFAGDGGDTVSVANAPDGKWINLFTPDGNRFRYRRLVNMKYHRYKLEPNVHFSPDMKWIIFRANFEGFESVYAVEIAPFRQ